MYALKKDPLWIKAVSARKIQTVFGYISGICFAIALVSLSDGLLAQMRSGSNELSLLPGETVILSGPTALKNPIASDLRAVFTPPGAQLSFELEGFFTGYWFGSGMWRGRVTAQEHAAPGEYKLRISFRGTSAQNAQAYVFVVFASSDEMRAASLSIIKRISNINPFILAAGAVALALASGLVTFIFGRNYTLNLRKLGLAQVWATQGDNIWCLVPRELAPGPGKPRMILNEHGDLLAEANTGEWHKGKLRLTVMDATDIPGDSLVCMRHPDSHLSGVRPRP